MVAVPKGPQVKAVAREQPGLICAKVAQDIIDAIGKGIFQRPAPGVIGVSLDMLQHDIFVTRARYGWITFGLLFRSAGAETWPVAA